MTRRLLNTSRHEKLIEAIFLYVCMYVCIYIYISTLCVNSHSEYFSRLVFPSYCPSQTSTGTTGTQKGQHEGNADGAVHTAYLSTCDGLVFGRVTLARASWEHAAL